ncbi:phosphatidylethanolamine-binding protein [Podospora didyma]|uniref:Phosphatidylethanolamine-binding protein n=1 Tax=Podospora didyma TaxID=330526 RepID=A0AAE0N4L1_9PEZI|nr:phosphatidylethanolamine-binding protein [Podospora didyma]
MMAFHTKPFRLLSLWAVLGIAIAGAILPSDQHVFSGSFDGTGNAAKVEDKIVKKLKKAEIIPTVIDEFVPSLLLHAKWSSKNKAELGNTLKPSKLDDAPSVSLHAPSDSSSSLCTNVGVTYTVALTDPDAPSRDDPKWSEMCHWIATGVSASTKSKDKNSRCPTDVHLADLEEVMPYKAPGPPEKTGKHRYVFLAFIPANGTTEKLHLSKPSDRQHWGYDTDDGETKGVREWAAENGLVPVAANFIYAKNKKQ